MPTIVFMRENSYVIWDKLVVREVLYKTTKIKYIFFLPNYFTFPVPVRYLIKFQSFHKTILLIRHLFLADRKSINIKLL